MSDNKTLRELVSISSAIEDALIQSGGELTPELETALAVKDMQLPEKVDGYSLVIDRMSAVSEFYAEKAELFTRLSGAAKNVVSKCKDNIKFAMTEMNVTELAGYDYKFKLQNSPASVEMLDETKVPDAYKIIKTVTTVDKKKVLEDLKIGVPVEGAELKQGTHVRSYANNKARS
jgi:Siphovirus Gp157